VIAMLERLLPSTADNRLAGRRAALWLLGLYLALRLVMSANSILNSRMIATGDGFPLDRYGAEGAHAVLMLFELTALGQLALVLAAIGIMIRYRALVPLACLVLLAEQVARRAIIASYAVERTETAPVIWYLIYGPLALLAIALILSLLPGRRRVEPA
jgi:hypothetical protein